MPKDLLLILRALRKHWTICILLVVQISIACAILGNGLNLVGQRYALQRLANGIAEQRLIVLDVQALQGRLSEAQRDEVLLAVASLPGVSSTAYVNALPFSGRGGAYKIASEADGIERNANSSLYFGSVGFLDTLGVRIVSGRGFAASDFGRPGENPLATVATIILSESLSRRLSAPVGSRIQVANRSLTVIGIVENVLPPVLVSPDDAGNTAFVASPPGGVLGSQIIVNADPSAIPALLLEITAAATRKTPQTLIWYGLPFAEIRLDYFKLDRAVIRLIFGLGILLSLVVAGGVGGLSSYWITRRHKQIAIRRALGARRRDIAWYFHVENLIITSLGAVLGLIGAIAVSVMLTKWLALPSMPIAPLSWGALVMIVIGQLAVLAPVRRAVSVLPAVIKTA
ncbi:MAG: FtsX-like permease family protein [Luteimonas sp.]